MSSSSLSRGILVQQQRRGLSRHRRPTMRGSSFVSTAARTSTIIPHDIAVASRHCFSTAAVDSPSSNKKAKQSFVQATLRPGEWDAPHYTDPLYRPAFTGRAKLLHQDDFARRPQVGINEEFANPVEAMVALSWLDQSTSRHLYEIYLELLEQHTTSANNNNKDNKGVPETSHEYVVRVLAQKFQLTAERVAAVIQLQHNEAQMVRQGRILSTEAAEYMDKAIAMEILEYYATFNMKPPAPVAGLQRTTTSPTSSSTTTATTTAFVEDPVGIQATTNSKSWVVLEDLVDDEKDQERLARLQQKATQMIDEHVYLSDIPDSHQTSPLVDPSLRRLVRAQRKFMQQSTSTMDNPQQQQQQQELTANDSDDDADDDADLDDWGDDVASEAMEDEHRRPRWKFVAQLVDTRRLKKAKQAALQKASTGNRTSRKLKGYATSYKNDTFHNTVVEQNGRLRPGTLQEVRSVSWKPARGQSRLDIQEFVYRKAKEGFMAKVHDGRNDLWGLPSPAELEALAAKKEQAAAAEKENVGEEDSDSDSSDDDDDDDSSVDSNSSAEEGSDETKK